MMFDIFSSLDFSTTSSTLRLLSLGAINMILVYFIFLNLMSKKFINSFFSSLVAMTKKLGGKKFKVKTKKNLKFSYLMLVSIFGVMLGFNLLGLFPYIFSVTSQVIISISISLIVWVSMKLSSVKFNFVTYWAHLTPTGSPKLLNPMLNMIELVSNMMRFLTLSLRLSINMTTGHVFLTLISMFVCFSSFSWKILLFFIMFFMGVGYLIFELAIGGMQAFVFALLSSQYLEEHATK